MIAYFEVPYEHFLKNEIPARRLILNQMYRDFHQAKGILSEAELNGDKALVRVRGTDSLIRIIQKNFPVTRVSDPLSVWSPTYARAITVGGEIVFDKQQSPTKTIEQLMKDVLSDEESDQIKRIADQLIPRIESEGYVKLVGYDWEYSAKILSYFSSLGYGLNRISTGTFPTTSVLDDFNRADQVSPGPPSASWDWNAFAGPNASLWITGNNVGGGSSGGRHAYWKTPFNADQEALFTIATIPDDGSDIFTLLRGTQPSTGGAAVSVGGGGYSGGWIRHDATGDAIQSYRYDTVAGPTTNFVQLGVDEVLDGMQSGHKFGSEVIGTVLQNYVDMGAGWTSAGTPKTASTIVGGVIGLGHGGTSARLDDAGGGNVISSAPGAFTTTRKIIWATRP